MYKYLLFDADNTLLDFDKAEYIGFKSVLSFYNVPFSHELFQRYLEINHSLWSKLETGVITKQYVQTMRFSLFFHSLGMTVDGYDANNMYQMKLKEQSWLMPNAKEVCEKLAHNHSLSIVTNGVGETQKARVCNSEISKYISNLFISEDIGVEKPNKLFFTRVFSELKCDDLSQAIIIGDSLSSDIQGGRVAGIQTCWYNPKCLVNNTDISPDYIISDLKELMLLL